MATSGSTSVSVTSYDTLRFNWWLINSSIPNNRSFIGWSLDLVAGTHGLISSTAPKSWSVTVNGTTYSGTNSVGISANSTKTLASGQTVINHNADGTKSFTYSFSQEFSITFGGSSVGTKTGAGTGILDTLPRATQPTLSVSTIDMGAAVTINLPRASSNFTHDLAYAFAGGSYIAIATGVATSQSWTVPLSLADSIPNAVSGTVTIRCITKNGTATVGTKTVLLTAKVPASVKPSITSVNITEATSGIAVYGLFVQSKSSIKATIAATGARSSTIKSYTSTLLGKSYTGQTWTSGVLNQSGTLSIVTTVTDSRGRTASKKTDITVLAYTTSSISTFSVSRADSSGTADTEGTYLRARAVYSVASLGGKNTAEAKLEYRRTGTTAWTTLAVYSQTSMDGTLTPKGTTFSTDYEWEFRLTVEDEFGAPTTYTSVLPSGAVILDIRADGKGIAFFKTSTKDGVEIAGELPGSAIPLQTSANLNSLTSPGFYVIPTATISGTVTNKPYTDTSPASIRVERTGETSLRQTLQKSSTTDGVIYERGYASGSWGAWHIVYSGAGRLLWSGSYLMTSGQTVTLAERISVQQSGIVLVFSRYISNVAVDYFYSCHFVPKQLVTAALSAGQTSASVSFVMATNKFEAISGKYLYIKDDIIGGNDANSATGSANGVTYSNGAFALRYVIGV